VFLIGMGIPLFMKVSNFVDSFREDGGPSSINDDTPPPPPRLESLPEYTNENKLQIDGTTEEGATVTIHFNDEIKEIIAGSGGDFSTSFTLVKGENTVFAYATDKAGNKSIKSQTYSISFDNEPPDLEIIKPSSGESFFGTQQKQLSIEGQTEGEASVTINDRVVVVNSSGKFNLPVSLENGENKFMIVSTDRAGNKTELELVVSYSS